MNDDLPRVAPEIVYATAPGLGRFTDRVLFGRVWSSDALAPRDRSLLTFSALIGGGKAAQIGGHAGRALEKDAPWRTASRPGNWRRSRRRATSVPAGPAPCRRFA